jgi:phosphatidylserine decarboxylase
VARNVKARDAFWIKGQNYSLSHMLGTTVGDLFVGATIYQGYLDSFSYHRWHAPVSGRISKTYLLNGTYYSSPAPIDMNPPDHSVGVTIGYQPYLAAMATRAVIIIDADNPDIDQLAFLAIGMVEVSTCEISVKEGEYVRKRGPVGDVPLWGIVALSDFQKGSKSYWLSGHGEGRECTSSGQTGGCDAGHARLRDISSVESRAYLPLNVRVIVRN